MVQKNYKNNINNPSVNYSIQAIKFLDPQNKLLDCDTDGMLDFEVQTTLESFINTKKQ